MMLSVAIYCLSSPLFHERYNLYSDQILEIFVKDFGKLYGDYNLVYNVHGLVHIAKDVRSFGPLEHFSAFVFESFLGRLKRLVRKPNFPLQQVIKRFSENCVGAEGKSIPVLGAVKGEHCHGPLPIDVNKFSQFSQIQLPLAFFSVHKGNNCVLIGNKVALIVNIVCESPEHQKFLVVKEFLQKTNFFDIPLPSSDLLIYTVNNLSTECKVYSIEDVVCKCVLIPFRDRFVSMPLVHTL